MRESTGFTLIEILIAIVIILLLSSIVIGGFSRLTRSYVLEKEVGVVRTVLADARARTLSSKDDSAYGVHLQTNQVVLFKGATYSAGDPLNEVFAIDSGVSLSSIALTGGATNIVFERLSGKANATGTVTVLLASDNSSAQVTIYTTGVAE